MFTPVNIESGGHENLTLWDTHDICVNRSGNDAEIVIHPAGTANVRIRIASAPYTCEIFFRSRGKVDNRLIYLGDQSDLGNIDTSDHRHPKFGNDVDGYRRISSVADCRGNIIPLEKFCQDVEDQLMYFEDR